VACLSTDVGDAIDVNLAYSAARAVDVPFAQVSTEPSDWTNHFSYAARRMDYATTLHTWSVGLTKEAIRRGRGVAAGMGGGITLNDHIQDRSQDLPRVRPSD
jgi:hypothetical protein